MRAGTEFPPDRGLVGWRDVLALRRLPPDRRRYARRPGIDNPTEIRDGPFAEAQWDSYSANAVHGIRRTLAETESVIRLAIQHPNAGKLTDVLISKHLHVPRATVQYWRKKISCQTWQDIKVRTVTRGTTTYELTTTNLGKKNGERRVKPRRDLQTEIAEMRKQASTPAKSLLNTIEKWTLGLVPPSRCLEVIENFLKWNGIHAELNNPQSPDGTNMGAIH